MRAELRGRESVERWRLKTGAWGARVYAIALSVPAFIGIFWHESGRVWTVVASLALSALLLGASFLVSTGAAGRRSRPSRCSCSTSSPLSAKREPHPQRVRDRLALCFPRHSPPPATLMSSSPPLPKQLTLTVLSAPLALCRLSAADAIPGWTTRAQSFLSISLTPTELSIVADESAVPPQLDAQRGYRALRVEGPLPLDLIGIFAPIASSLAAASIPIFPIATYDTDYVLVASQFLEKAIATLEAAGYRIIAAEGDRD